MKKILVRAFSGAVYVALIVAALLLPSPYLFLCLFSLFLVLGVIELHRLIGGSFSSGRRLIVALDCIGGVSMFATLFFTVTSLAHDHSTFICGMASGALLLLYFIARMVAQLYLKEENAVRCFAHSALSMTYVAMPLTLLNVLQYIYGADGNNFLLAIFILIWLYDTGAFCVGSLIGRHRLFERISPKKSWEGLWGGVVLCLLACVAAHYWGEPLFKPLTLWHWLGLGAVVATFATWGDLAESLIKRTVGVKDSGHVLPGHGGILDRIDSLLLVSPAVTLYLFLITIL